MKVILVIDSENENIKNHVNKENNQLHVFSVGNTKCVQNYKDSIKNIENNICEMVFSNTSSGVKSSRVGLSLLFP